MKYIIIEGNLSPVFNSNSNMREDFTGMIFSNDYYIKRKNKEPVYLVEITNENLAKEYILKFGVEIKEGVDNFNKDIDKYYEVFYYFWNEPLSANDYSVKVNKGILDINEVSAKWTQYQRMEWMYHNGIMGIKTNNKPPYKV